MKIISLFLLVLLSANLFAQISTNLKPSIKDVFISLPDSTMHSSYFELPKEKRIELWKLIEDKSWDLIYNSEGISFNGLNPMDDLIKMTMVRLLDPMPKCEIKIFSAPESNNVGITYYSYDGATTSTEKTIFYEYDNGNYEDVTEEIYNSFNYYTDNFTTNTIDSLNLYYKTNLRETPIHNDMIYRFTKTDTVHIIQNFYDYFFDYDNPGLDTTYFDGEFYTKKYIMENGKLRLAE
jgi:hypothetical protein